MAILRLAPIAVRTRRVAVSILVVGLILPAVGCKHRRSSLRPAFIEPPIADPNCTNCETPSPILDRAVPSSRSSEVILDEPTPTISPRVRSLDVTPDTDPILSPVRPPIDSKVRPSSESPPARDALDEPDLVPPASGFGSGSERTPKALIDPPALDRPSASRGTKVRSSTVTRTRSFSLEDRVKPFVNDPGDLFQPPKADRSWKYLVVHHSANARGSYDSIDREHRKIQGWDGCGYHFVIGNGTDSPDGQIEVTRRWSNQKYGLHCRSAKSPEVNEYGIGICLIGDLDQSPPTHKQIAATKALVNYLSQHYQIPADHAGTHAELADSPTACPGQYFPEEQIFGSKHLAAH